MKISILAFSLLPATGLTQARRLGDNEPNFITAARRDLGSNHDNCQSTIDNGGSGCGGGDGGNLDLHASCTPYPFRAPSGDQSQFTDFCNCDEVSYFAGADLSGSSDSYAVWYDGTGDNYWIIHGCDGSGQQIGDCGGGTGYVEQIGPYSQTYADSDTGVWNGKVVNIENDYDDGNMDAHVSTVFQHPGTDKVYDWLWAGMWTPGANDWAEEQKPWWTNWQKEGVQDPSKLSPDDSIFFSIYPWVCGLGTQDLSWFWNAGGAGKAMDPIYGTDCDSGGWCNDYAKCYYDNEPYSNIHDDGNSVPPTARFYKFYNNGDGTLTGWLLYENTYEGGDQIFDYTGACDSCDDNCLNNNFDSSGAAICFKLKRMDSIPW